MRRLLPTLSLLLMPIAAAGQALGGNSSRDAASYPYPQQSQQQTAIQPGALLLQSESGTTAQSQGSGDRLLTLNPLAGGQVSSSTLQYGLTSNVAAQASISQRSWANQAPRIIGSEVGATYHAGRYSLGLSVAQDQVPNAAALPRVLPGAVPGVDGLTDFDSSTQLNARGRLALGGNSGIVLGASMGRIRMLPGNLLGLNTLDQKALSFGIDHGPVTGSIIGRTMAPEPGMPGSFNADRRWNSIDLGVTWRLPWQGSLSFGAQNLWSSGNMTNTPAGPPEPDQSRTPYVQYHQDL